MYLPDEICPFPAISYHCDGRILPWLKKTKYQKLRTNNHTTFHHNILRKPLHPSAHPEPIDRMLES